MEEERYPEEKKSNLKIFLIICVVILLGMNMFLGYLYLTNTREIKDKKRQIKFTTQQLLEAQSKIDSMEFQIERQIREFEALQDENDSLSAIHNSIDSLKRALSQVKSLKNHFKRDATKAWFLYNEQKDKLEGFTELLNLKDKQIAALKKQNEQLFNENIKLKKAKVEISKSIDSLEFEKAELEEKIKVASTLEANEIKVSYVNKRMKEKDRQPFKGSKITRLKIDFTLALNKVAKVETKRIFFRVISPRNETMMDQSEGRLFFSKDGKVFTGEVNVLYRREENQKVTVFYSKGGAYVEGMYKLQLYCEGYMIGETEFEIK